MYKGQPAALRHEGTHCGGRRRRSSAHGHRHDANESDIEQVAYLLHGKEQDVWADSSNSGAQSHVTRDDLHWHIAGRPIDMAKLRERRAKQRLKKQEHGKAIVRAKVEHPFRVIKRQSGLAKVTLRRLAKNTAHVVNLFALSNLWMARSS